VRIDGGYDGNRYSQTRYIGFGAVGGASQELPTLQYGTDQTVKQHFVLAGHDYGDNFDVPDVSITQNGSTLANYLQTEGPFNCIIVLQFEGGPEIRIPVENDVVRADKARLPPGYSLRIQ
jgi:hypothetical protein